MKHFLLSFFLLTTAFVLKAAAAADVTVVHLKCNFKENPLGVETPNPALSWQLLSDKRQQKQTAYRILVSDTDWSEGSVSGLCTRGAFEIALNWADKKLTKTAVSSKKGGTTMLVYQNQTKKITLKAGERTDIVW